VTIRSAKDFDYADPAFQHDPYPNYAVMRRESPVHFRRIDDQLSVWACFRYDDVVSVLKSPDFDTMTFPPEIIDAFIAQPDSPFHALARIVNSVMLVKDGGDHTRLRGLVNKAFTPRMVEALRPRIRDVASELLDDLEGRDEFDLLTEFAAPFPIIVIAELLGIPAEDREDLRRWSDHMATFLDGSIRDAHLPSAGAAAHELASYLEGIFEERRREPRDDLISGLVSAHEADDALSDDELLATVALVLGAGHETTTNLIGNGVLALLRHPDQAELLRREPDLIEPAVEELLRYDSPVQNTSRTPRECVVVGGQEIPAGIEVNLFLGSANRDPAEFADPDVLDITRQDNRHLAFGHGVHFCLGASLARIEGQLAIGALLDRFPTMKLSKETLEYRPGLVLRGLQRLPIRI
jgi:cytochrome P450